MKNFILLLTLLFTFSACGDDNVYFPFKKYDSYELAAIYVDQGSGYGEFEDVESDRTIYIVSESVLATNADICDVYQLSGDRIQNISFDPVTNELLTNCRPNFLIHGDTLTMYYPCLEGCRHRFIKK